MTTSIRPQRPDPTKKELEDAGEDARYLMQQSPIVRIIVATMIVARRLYITARSALDNELADGWEIDDPGLVVDTLVLSAQEKANEKFKVQDLIVGVLGTSLPFLHAIAQHVAETGTNIDGTEIFSTVDPPEPEHQDGK